jgi:hypothetical protein
MPLGIAAGRTDVNMINHAARSGTTIGAGTTIAVDFPVVPGTTHENGNWGNLAKTCFSPS